MTTTAATNSSAGASTTTRTKPDSKLPIHHLMLHFPPSNPAAAHLASVLLLLGLSPCDSQRPPAKPAGNTTQPQAHTHQTCVHNCALKYSCYSSDPFVNCSSQHNPQLHKPSTQPCIQNTVALLKPPANNLPAIDLDPGEIKTVTVTLP
jgi:hypothetical protein